MHQQVTSKAGKAIGYVLYAIAFTFAGIFTLACLGAMPA